MLRPMASCIQGYQNLCLNGKGFYVEEITTVPIEGLRLLSNGSYYLM